MESIKIMNNLHLFNSYIGFIDLTFNQYLLLGSEPILIHTGSRDMAAELVPQLKAILSNRELSYIFISHFESDECGGLSLIQEHFPKAKPVCSQVTARQLTGFGLAKDIIVRAPGDTLEAGDFKLRFINYPSEMHLWEGLMVFEENLGLLFSSDLFIQRGSLKEAVVNADFHDEIRKISLQQIPSPEANKALQEALTNLPVKYVVPGHGPCLKV